MSRESVRIKSNVLIKKLRSYYALTGNRQKGGGGGGAGAFESLDIS